MLLFHVLLFNVHPVTYGLVCTEPGQRKKKIARFGITTSRGPSCEESKCTIGVDNTLIACITS
jgi:hypothetical protein